MTPEKWSEAYKQYRLNLMRDKFGFVVLIIVLVPSVLYAAVKRKRIISRLSNIFKIRGKELHGKEGAGI
jgi:hypothetical protein